MMVNAFTPSPIYPTYMSIIFNVFTTFSFCKGFILANTDTVSTFLLVLHLSSYQRLFLIKFRYYLFPLNCKCYLLHKDYLLLIFFVVTPIFLNFCNVSFTSFFAGSKNATNPINVISFSSDTLNIFAPFVFSFEANAITCIP